MFWEGLLEAMEPVLQAGFLVAWEMVVSVLKIKRLSPGFVNSLYFIAYATLLYQPVNLPPSKVIIFMVSAPSWGQ